MASLDKLEGDGLEAAGFGVLAVIGILAYLAYKNFAGMKVPNLSEAITELWNRLKTFLTMAQGDWGSTLGAGTGGGADWVYTGTSTGNYGATAEVQSDPGADAIEIPLVDLGGS
jgi:hypothetical protein